MRKLRYLLLCSVLIVSLLLSSCALVSEDSSSIITEYCDSDKVQENVPIQDGIETPSPTLTRFPAISEVRGCKKSPKISRHRIQLTCIDGKEFSNTVTEIAVDSTDGLMENLKYLPCVETVDMTSFDVSTDEVDVLREVYPDIFFIFYITVIGYRVRTDILCFSTMCMASMETGLHYRDVDLAPLFKYCTKLEALDVGHNYLYDISAMANLTNLKFLILGDNRSINDISPLGALKNLEYLELFSVVSVPDFEVLKQFSKLEYLNVSNNRALQSMDFLDYMPDLKMLWIMDYYMTKDYIKHEVEAHPYIQIVYSCIYGGDSVTCCGWRASDCNCAIRTAFANWQHVTDIDSWKDIKYDCEVTPISPTTEHGVSNKKS